jgi:Fe-S cluster assembly iron-binding protein IscA
MLTITPQASEAIRGILASESFPDGSMLRIGPPPQNGSQPGQSLAISVVETAPASDQVVEGDQVEVAVEPTTAEILDDKELDATIAEGQVNFTIGEREEGI